MTADYNTEKFPDFPISSHSLLKKYLTPALFEQLQSAKSKHGFTLSQMIRTGIENPDSSIGVYIGDLESCTTFSPLLDKIIEDYHGHSPDAKHASNLDPSTLHVDNPDPKSHYILSTRIRVARNLHGFPLGPLLHATDRKRVEANTVTALKKLTGELAGEYHALENMSDVIRGQLIADHFLFKEGDRFMASAGLNREWPEARGIFHNANKTLLVWVNEEDHMRIISMQPGGDIKAVFTRLARALDILNAALNFTFSDHLGYITSCPSNFGTAMRASVHIRLPNLANSPEKFQALAAKYQLQIRGIDGEHSESRGGVFDISNRRRLGITEVECVQAMHDGIAAIIAAEKSFD